MKNKSITWAIFGICLILIALIIIPGILTASENNMRGSLEKVYQFAQNEDWTSAAEASDELLRQWESQKFLIALNYAEEDYATFQHTILRVTSAVANEDKDNVMAESEVAENILNQNFGKLVPEP
jgi:ribosome-binding ATPase YchF (GTP1/OBG family)